MRYRALTQARMDATARRLREMRDLDEGVGNGGEWG
jgi:hypothetical protein